MENALDTANPSSIKLSCDTVEQTEHHSRLYNGYKKSTQPCENGSFFVKQRLSMSDLLMWKYNVLTINEKHQELFIEEKKSYNKIILY